MLILKKFNNYNYFFMQYINIFIPFSNNDFFSLFDINDYNNNGCINIDDLI